MCAQWGSSPASVGSSSGSRRPGSSAICSASTGSPPADVAASLRCRGRRRHPRAPVAAEVRCRDAGFPCTDLSQVGRTAGIDGEESGLVREVFRLIAKNPPTWLVLENVPNMLSLHGGAPIRYITMVRRSAGTGPIGPSTRSTSGSVSAGAACSSSPRGPRTRAGAVR